MMSTAIRMEFQMGRTLLCDTPNDDLKQVDLKYGGLKQSTGQEYHKTVQPNLIMTNSDHEGFSFSCVVLILTIDLSCMQQVKEPNQEFRIGFFERVARHF